AERITFVDNQGRVILGEEALVTWAKMIFDLKPNARIAVPVSTTHELDKLAAKSGATVVRTKTNARALMDAALNEKVECSLDENCGIIFPAFQAAFDGIFSTVKLLE
ncbi:MAG TPA: nucleotidyltransferase, partial [Candidatus Rifleibacterium sp.]|nr:nucleotidyltransferase [Candidatus Rifleibacterium sp.]